MDDDDFGDFSEVPSDITSTITTGGEAQAAGDGKGVIPARGEGAEEEDDEEEEAWSSALAAASSTTMPPSPVRTKPPVASAQAMTAGEPPAPLPGSNGVAMSELPLASFGLPPTAFPPPPPSGIMSASSVDLDDDPFADIANSPSHAPLPLAPPLPPLPSLSLPSPAPPVPSTLGLPDMVSMLHASSEGGVGVATSAMPGLSMSQGGSHGDSPGEASFTMPLTSLDPQVPPPSVSPAPPTSPPLSEPDDFGLFTAPAPPTSLPQDTALPTPLSPQQPPVEASPAVRVTSPILGAGEEPPPQAQTSSPRLSSPVPASAAALDLEDILGDLAIDHVELPAFAASPGGPIADEEEEDWVPLTGAEGVVAPPVSVSPTTVPPAIAEATIAAAPEPPVAPTVEFQTEPMAKAPSEPTPASPLPSPVGTSEGLAQEEEEEEEEVFSSTLPTPGEALQPAVLLPVTSPFPQVVEGGREGSSPVPSPHRPSSPLPPSDGPQGRSFIDSPSLREPEARVAADGAAREEEEEEEEEEDLLVHARPLPMGRMVSPGALDEEGGAQGKEEEEGGEFGDFSAPSPPPPPPVPTGEGVGLREGGRASEEAEEGVVIGQGGVPPTVSPREVTSPLALPTTPPPLLSPKPASPVRDPPVEAADEEDEFHDFSEPLPAPTAPISSVPSLNVPEPGLLEVSTPEAVGASPPDNSDEFGDFGDFSAPPPPVPTTREAHLPTPQAMPPPASPPSLAPTTAAAVEIPAEGAISTNEQEGAEEEEDDWGDFGEAEFQAAPPLPAQGPAGVDTGTTPLPLAVSSPTAAIVTGHSAAVEDDFGDFGDFEADSFTPLATATGAAFMGGGDGGVVGAEGGMAHEEKAEERPSDKDDWMQVPPGLQGVAAAARAFFDAAYGGPSEGSRSLPRPLDLAHEGVGESLTGSLDKALPLCHYFEAHASAWATSLLTKELMTSVRDDGIMDDEGGEGEETGVISIAWALASPLPARPSSPSLDQSSSSLSSSSRFSFNLRRQSAESQAEAARQATASPPRPNSLPAPSVGRRVGSPVPSGGDRSVLQASDRDMELLAGSAFTSSATLKQPPASASVSPGRSLSIKASLSPTRGQSPPKAVMNGWAARPAPPQASRLSSADAGDFSLDASGRVSFDDPDVSKTDQTEEVIAMFPDWTYMISELPSLPSLAGFD